ncbi:MAG: hypothetical protein WC716_03230 [Chitinophagaceae bacterium]|jgi:hypothetical protein
MNSKKLYKKNNSFLLGLIIPAILPIIPGLFLFFNFPNDFTLLFAILSVINLILFTCYYLYFTPLAFIENNFIFIKTFSGKSKFQVNDIKKFKTQSDFLTSIFDLKILIIETNNGSVLTYYLPTFDNGEFMRFISENSDSKQSIMKV